MTLSTIALSLLASASVAVAAAAPAENVIPGRYIVEFDEDATPALFARQVETDYQTRMEYDYELFKGLSIQLDDSISSEERVAHLAGLPAVRHVWPVKLLDRPTPIGASPLHNSTVNTDVRRAVHHKRQTNCKSLANTPHVMTGVDKLHAEGITGEGIKIAVIDSGIDYHHPALGGCFGEGCKVAFGADLVGDNYVGDNEPLPSGNPDDTCDGHGTHVAGIIAATGDNPFGFIGAAPDVTLGAYRVLGCRGSVADDVFIDSFLRAYEDGADIITSSIGVRNGWASDAWTVAVSRIVEKGVPCTIAQGNGNEGMFFSVSPADGKGVAAITSFQNTNQPLNMIEAFYTIDDGPSESFGWDWGWPNVFDGVERELWVTGYDTNKTNDACEPLPDDTPDLSEYIVLLRRSTKCTPRDQAINAASKGARFVLLYNNGADDVLKLEIDGYEETENILGSGQVIRKLGESWVQAIEAGSTVRAQLNSLDESEEIIVIEENTHNAGAPSPFNSWGPSLDMDLKPTFGTPGGGIISTFPLEMGGFEAQSGTSMATPFAAAVYALLAQAKNIKPNPQLFERLLASTATPKKYVFAEGPQDWLAPPVNQGAGLINAFEAAYADAYLEPSSLSFNDTANAPDSLNFTIVNTGDNEITYEIEHRSTQSWYCLTDNELTFPTAGSETTPEHAEIALSSNTVTVAPGETVSIDVTATPPSGVNEKRYPVWGGFISLAGSDGSSLSLPYVGVVGSLYDATMAREDGKTLITDINSINEPIGEDMTFTIPPVDEPTDWEAETPTVPVFQLNLIWGTPHVTAEVFPINSTLPASITNSIGELSGLPLIWEGATGIYKEWRGQLNNGEFAPAGKYKIVAKILRIYGDAAKDEDWHRIESSPFTIQYAES